MNSDPPRRERSTSSTRSSRTWSRSSCRWSCSACSSSPSRSGSCRTSRRRSRSAPTAIEGGLKAAETKQAEADAKLAELEKQLADARHEAARIREEAREQGAQIVAEMREQAQTESSRIVEHGKAQIEAERQQAVTSLRAEVGTLATGLAGRIVGREPRGRGAVQSRVVERFLADLETSSLRRLERERGPLMDMRGHVGRVVRRRCESTRCGGLEAGARRRRQVAEDLFGLADGAASRAEPAPGGDRRVAPAEAKVRPGARHLR